MAAMCHLVTGRLLDIIVSRCSGSSICHGLLCCSIWGSTVSVRPGCSRLYVTGQSMSLPAAR